MSKEYSTIRVTKASKKAAEQEKQPDETWSEYLLRCGDADVPRKWTEDEIREIVRDELRQLQGGVR